MSVSEDDVRHVASLARLEVPPERLAPLVNELNRILDYVGVLQQVELGGAAEAEADVAVAGDAAALREDMPGAVPLAREIADFAPASRDGFFLVPRLSTHE